MTESTGPGAADGAPPGRRDRGHLRIYLGSAPGVGKTYAMLNEAHRRLDRGTDVVVGLVEPHGRSKTAALLDGLEVLPRRTISYRGTTFEEMDVDAVLARRPAVALVDELAHSNIPGSRNGKRWQDIEELLEAGITVLSTVNIQHPGGDAPADGAREHLRPGQGRRRAGELLPGRQPHRAARARPAIAG